MAASAYSFMLQHMRDGSDGLWHWNVSRTGGVIQPRKVLYGQWFVLYAFSQYYAAFGDASAKDLALHTFTTLDALWHNPSTGGYTENSDNSFPAESVGVGIGLREQSGEEEEGGLMRTFNTLLHGIEALTALHKVTADATVLQRLLELMEVVCTRLQRQQGLVFEEYLPAADGAQWTPAQGTSINYGHNLEASWLLLDTLSYLQSITAIDPQAASTYTAAAVAIGSAATQAGYDAQHGGVFESGTVAEGPVSMVKFWWIQAEAMLAFWQLHRHFEGLGDVGQSQAFLNKLVETAGFVRQHLVDHQHGEQFWQVEADGPWRPTGISDKDTAGNRWKASYHSSRAPLFLLQWMQAAAVV